MDMRVSGASNTWELRDMQERMRAAQERGQEAEESAEVVEPAEPDYDDYAAPGEVAGISLEDVAVLVAIARRHRAGM